MVNIFSANIYKFFFRFYLCIKICEYFSMFFYASVTDDSMTDVTTKINNLSKESRINDQNYQGKSMT